MTAAAGMKGLTATLAAAVALLVLPGGASGGYAGSGDRSRDREPPTAPANLRVTDATASSIAVAWDPSTDNNRVRGYYVDVNGRRYTTSSTEFNVRRLRCGESVTIWVVAYDRSGNRSARAETIASTAACPDTESPMPPTGIRQVATAQDAVVLAWDPPTDNVGVVGYGVYRGGFPVASSREPTVTLSGLTCDSAYEYALDAVDAAGNRSARAPYWVVTAACADVEPPSTPADLTLTGRTAVSLSVEWSPSSDNVAVVGYHVMLNGAQRMSASASGPGGTSNTNATLTGLACGTGYDVGVEAYDSAGNESPPAILSAETDDCADDTPPSAPSGLVVVGSTTTSVSLRWNASTDDVGVEGYGVYVNGTSAPSVSSAQTTVSGLACGTAYTFGVDAYDRAENRSATATVGAATAACPSPPAPPVDTTPPSQPANLAVGAATRTSVSLTWTAATDNVGVTGYGVYRNGMLVTTVSQPGATVSGLVCGTASAFEVDAVDAARNRSSRASVTAATATCPDTQAPTTPANVTATSRTTTSIALTWSNSTDNVGVTGYGIYLGGQLVGSVTGTTGIFPDLTCDTGYTLSVDAYDAAGNRSAKTTLMVATASCPAPQPTVTMGESSVMPVNDSGNGNLLISQKATLAQTGILRRMSFYVTTASGNLRLGVYAANGAAGGPGTKLTETPSFTPTAGWNSVAVAAPVTLAAGTYWLAYLPSSSTLAFRVGNGGEARWQSYSYGSMPATFPAATSGDAVKWSLYATLDVTNEVPPPLPPPSPDLPPPPPATQCADGADNDTDGLVDMTDVGCTDPADNDETNATPAPAPAPTPPTGGFPNASNTGPTGTLVESTGNITVSTAGTIIQNRKINGCIDVRANNVTIRNSEIRCGGYVIRNLNGNTGLLIEDVLIECGHQPGDTGVTSGNYTIRRSEVFGCENNLWANLNTVIEDNYIHDTIPCCSWPNAFPHTDSIQMSTPTSNVRIEHNTVYGGYVNQQEFGNAAITSGRSTNVLVTNNLLAGGGHTLRCPAEPGGFTWTNNRFSRILVNTVGGFGPLEWSCGQHTNSGNVYDETGQPINPG
jgi:chitodextrinase